jgi:hypothetical protein
VGIRDIRQTHTYVELELSKAAYDEIATKLMAAGYQHCFPVGYEHSPGDGPIDMHGLAVVPETQK